MEFFVYPKSISPINPTKWTRKSRLSLQEVLAIQLAIHLATLLFFECHRLPSMHQNHQLAKKDIAPYWGVTIKSTGTNKFPLPNIYCIINQGQTLSYPAPHHLQAIMFHSLTEKMVQNQGAYLLVI